MHLEQVQGSASTSKTTSEADGFFGAGFLALGAKKLRTSPPADDALRLAGAERRFAGGARCGGGGGGFGASGARGIQPVELDQMVDDGNKGEEDRINFFNMTVNLQW